MAERLLALFSQSELVRPIYLCRKAAASVAGNAFALADHEAQAANEISVGTWVTSSAGGATNAEVREFVERYRAKTGVWPSFAALQIYDAVRLVAKSLRVAGANRSRLRDYLASGNRFAGLSGTIVFDPAGNTLGETHLLQLAPTNRPPAL
jgi:ABC-type branched-subunit amino acid transport system substrate-binding protein